MASKPTSNGPLTGEALALAGVPLAATPRGGSDSAFRGVTGPSTRAKKRPAPTALDPRHDPRLPADGPAPQGVPQGVPPMAGPADAPADAPAPDAPAPAAFAGMGPWLEGADAQVFQTAHGLVLRQELLAQNHLALDTHFTRVKLGCPFSMLEKDENRSVYKATLPAGMQGAAIAAVPNKAWDLCNKATETVLVDFAEPEVTPANDSEQAQASATMAQRFLDENGGEQGTNDVQLFYAAMDKALPCASSYIEKWVDPVGGGWVPLQVLAHPQATDPSSPLVGPDGMPTTDPILRYVTAPDGGQFTDDASTAAPQWQPKIRSTLWFREHVRVVPEDVPVDLAEKVIVLGYCTLGEAKRRWSDVAAMAPDDLSALLDWTPPRFLVLLPPFQQARWKIAAGSEKEKQGASDERIMFYYRVYATASPENKHGADVVVTGAFGGRVLSRQLLAATVRIDGANGQPETTAIRCLDIPVTQVTPRADPDGRDPSGLSYMWLFAGATEFDAALATAFLEMVSLWVHPDSYIPSTSPVQAYQVSESRATGEPIPILRAEDRPVFGNQPLLPPGFWQAIEQNNQAIESIASLNKPITGNDNSREVSGKARQIAVQQAMVGLSRMQHPLNNARARDARITLQLAMRDFTVPQTVKYVGEDGSYQAKEWTGADFAQIGTVRVKAGTGTMMPPDAKVQYIGNLRNAGLLSPDDATAAARPAFASRLGISEDPHRQYIERCVESWLDGPPEGWEAAWGQHKQALAAYEAQVGPMQQQAQQHAQQAAQQGVALPPLPPLPKPPAAPWTPFATRPNDDEPQIAQLWVARLSKVISTVKYTQFPPAWREPLDGKYTQARQTLAAANAPLPNASPTPAGQTPGGAPPHPPGV